jgi:hypothetical protein
VSHGDVRRTIRAAAVYSASEKSCIVQSIAHAWTNPQSASAIEFGLHPLPVKFPRISHHSRGYVMLALDRMPLSP